MGAIVAAVAAIVIAKIGANAAEHSSDNALKGTIKSSQDNKDATIKAAEEAADAQEEAARLQAQAQVQQAQIDRQRDQDWLAMEDRWVQQDRQDMRDGYGYDSIFADIDRIDTWEQGAGYDQHYA